jgi:branched-chain amino acid transport system permease protein
MGQQMSARSRSPGPGVGRKRRDLGSGLSSDWAAQVCRQVRAHSWLPGVIGALALVVLAVVPQLASDYAVSFMINLLLYATLATAWGIFCGTTRLISLATAAFFGLGSYTVAVLAGEMPWPMLLALAGALGGGLALLVGICTLRLSGMYFVIFSFGMAELIKQLVTWYEAKVAGSVGRYVFIEVGAAEIYWQLLVLLVGVLGLGLYLSRSRLGFALRLIGDDQVAARSCGINTVLVRIAVLTGTAAVMAIAGAIVAPRWTYIDPSIAFNPVVSFQVVVMALLGGITPFYGPLLGVVPLVLAFEILTKYFPDHFSIVLGAIFLLSVYVLPGGLLGIARRVSRPAR